MSKDINRLLAQPGKGANEAKGTLAIIYRQILADLNITPMTFQRLMDRYLDDPRNGIPNDRKRRSSERGNLTKALKRPHMTWKVFLQGIQFLDPLKIEFEIRLHWRNKRVTAHALEMRLVGIDVTDDAQVNKMSRFEEPDEEPEHDD